MVWIGRVLIIRQVAEHAGGRCQIVISVLRIMTIGALPRRHGVQAGEREIDQRVIEGGRSPGNGGMALRAVRREVRLHVVRIRRALKIFQVARNASRTGQVVIVAGVAIDTLSRRHSVSARQRESDTVVVEFRV